MSASGHSVSLVFSSSGFFLSVGYVRVDAMPFKQATKRAHGSIWGQDEVWLHYM